MKENKMEDREKIIVQTSILGIIANLFLAAFKAVVGILSHSIAITLDAVNNLSDALSSVITIVGTKLAGRPADKKHPLGYGRVEYLTASIISILVLYAGITSLIESIKKILHPEKPDYSTVSLLIIFVAVLVKFFLGHYVKRTGEKVHSDNLIASGEDAGHDAILSLSVFLSALLFRFTGLSLESYLGLVISVFILKAGFDLLRDTLSQILGERVDSKLSEDIKAEVSGIDGVLGCYDLLFHNYGPDTYLASTHIEVNENMTAKELDGLMRKIEKQIFQKFNIILSGISIYSQNSENPELSNLQNEIEEIVLSKEHILQMHGFYLQKETNTIEMDLVIAYEEKDRHGLAEAIKHELSEKFPLYHFRITEDYDIS